LKYDINFLKTDFTAHLHGIRLCLAYMLLLLLLLCLLRRGSKLCSTKLQGSRRSCERTCTHCSLQQRYIR
jgi:hypothetical protein